MIQDLKAVSGDGIRPWPACSRNERLWNDCFWRWPPAEALRSLLLVTAHKLADCLGAFVGFGCSYVI
jgi:hypothetical protein